MNTLNSRTTLVACVLLLPMLASAAEPGDALCKADEEVVFNCFTGKKTASLCASPTEAAPTSLTYRYGASGTVENEFAATPENGRFFSGTVSPAAPRAWVSQVWFDRGNFRYLMTECVGGDCPLPAGLAVIKGEKIAMNASCKRPPGVRLPAFSRELVKFGSKPDDSKSSTSLLGIEAVDNLVYELYKSADK